MATPTNSFKPQQPLHKVFQCEFSTDMESQYPDTERTLLVKAASIEEAVQKIKPWEVDGWHLTQVRYNPKVKFVD